MKKIDITKTLGSAKTYSELQSLIKLLGKVLKEAP